LDEIDPRVLALIERLLRSRASALGDLALARIKNSELGTEGDSGEDADPYRPVPLETPQQRAFRQLDAAAQAVRSVLKRELMLLQSSVELARSFDNDRVRPDEVDQPFKLIVVPTEPTSDERPRGREFGPIDLLSGDRAAALSAVLAEWDAAVEATRGGIAGEGETGA